MAADGFSEERLRADIAGIFQQYMQPQLLQFHFADLFVSEQDDLEDQRRDTAVDQLINLLSVNNQLQSQDYRDKALRCLVDVARHSQWPSEASILLKEALSKLIQHHQVPNKNACECLLREVKLSDTRSWAFTFDFLAEHVKVLDYKGARDLLKILLETAYSASASVKTAAEFRELNRAVDLVVTLCDRSNNLLPAYFVINELMKLHDGGGLPRHWPLADKLSSFVETFRPVAQLISLQGRPYIYPIVCQTVLQGGSLWRLEQQALKALSKGLLPYDKEYTVPQRRLLFNIVKQPNCKEVLQTMLSTYKQEKNRVPGLVEDVFVAVILHALELTEQTQFTNGNGHGSNGDTDTHANIARDYWELIGNNLLPMALWIPLNIGKLLTGLIGHLSDLHYKRGRDDLCWLLLNVFQSLSMNKNTKIEGPDCRALFDLLNLLYSADEQVTMNNQDRHTVRIMAPTCLWIFLASRLPGAANQADFIPQTVKKVISVLQDTLKNYKTFADDSSDYMICVLCNAFPRDAVQTNLFPLILGALVAGPHVPPIYMPGGMQADPKQTPLSFAFLDSLCVTVRINLVQHLTSQLLAIPGVNPPLPSPALMETLSRLYHYNEPEMTQAVRSVVLSVIQASQKTQSPKYLSLACELMQYRMWNTSMAARLSLCTCVHLIWVQGHGQAPEITLVIQACLTQQILSLTSVDISNHLCLKQLMGLMGIPSSSQQQQQGGNPELKQTLSMLVEIEEMARVLILQFLRAVQIQMTDSVHEYIRERLALFLKSCPIQWPSYTLQCFPKPFADYFPHRHPGTQQSNHLGLRKQMESWCSKFTYNQNTFYSDFTTWSNPQNGNPPIFLCLVWKIAFDDLNGACPNVFYRVLEWQGASRTFSQLRTLCDYVVREYTAQNGTNSQLQVKYADALVVIVWKWHIISMDRLILAMALRPFEGNEAISSVAVIHHLLLANDSLERVRYVLMNYPAEYWTDSDVSQRHQEYHKKFPEPSWSQLGNGQAITAQYFGNTVLRLVPILDVVICRLLELLQPSRGWIERTIKAIIDNYFPLYRFSAHPIQFLFEIFVFYSARIRDLPLIRQSLLTAMLDATNSRHLLSREFIQICVLQSDGPEGSAEWKPDVDYFVRLVSQLAESSYNQVANDIPFNGQKARFSEEVNNPAYFQLMVTCCEVLSLAVPLEFVGNSLVELIARGFWSRTLASDNAGELINAVAILLTTLPISVIDCLLAAILNELIDTGPGAISQQKPERVLAKLRVSDQFCEMTDIRATRLLALSHATFQHASNAYLFKLPSFVQEQCKPVVKNEAQLLFICQLVGPSICRLFFDRPYMNLVMQVTVDFYEMLLVVDKNTPHDLFCEGIITDFFYHLKYQHVGDFIKLETDRIIPQFRPSLQHRLRYISHHGQGVVTPASNQSVVQPQDSV